MRATLTLSLALLATLTLWAQVGAQIRTVGGDPLMAVTDPTKAVPEANNKAKPLTVGQPVRLMENQDGTALVAVASATPENGRDIRYRLPMAALRSLPGKTHTAPPSWLPAPAPADVAARDVIAFEQDGFIVILSGDAKPLRLDKGQYPAVSPDGSLLVYSPDTRIGVKLVDLNDPGHKTRFFPSAMPILEKHFSPDGSKLAWRTDKRIELFDPHPAAVARPVTLVSGLTVDQTLQGFTHDGAALVVQDLEQVTWFNPDGTVRKKEPIGTFTDDPSGSSAAHYLPSPTAPNLLLIERDVFGTPAYERWANDAGAALYLYDAASGTNYRLSPRTITAVDPAWTPDGRRVYCAALPDSPPNGTHRIYRLNADGTGWTELAKGLKPAVGTRP